MLKKMYNKFSLSKTLRFELKPVGRTLDNIHKNQILEEGSTKYTSYLRLKPIIDDFFKEYIDKALKDFKFDINEKNIIREIYSSKGIVKLSDFENKNVLDEEDNKIDKLSKSITKHFKEYNKKINAFGKNLIKGKDESLLEKYLKENNLLDEYKNDIKEFSNFTTFLTEGLLKIREFIFTDTKEGSIAYRIINDNLLLFISNIRIYDKYQDILNEIINNNNLDIYHAFNLDNYNEFITEKGIEKYNSVIAGIALENQKIKGLNEYINEYNQVHDKKDKIPFFKQLKKQILADRENLSFIYEKFEQDEDLYNALSQYKKVLNDNLHNIKNLLFKIDTFDLNNIYIKKNRINFISNLIYDDYSKIDTSIKEYYDNNYSGKTKKQTKKYDLEKEKYFKETEDFSLNYLLNIINDKKIIDYIKNILNEELIKKLNVDYQEVLNLINDSLRDDKKIIENKDLKDKIRLLLENLIEIRKNINLLNSNNLNKDLVFYNQYEELLEELNISDTIFNQSRNYLTKKPFSTEKMRLHFGKSNLLNGWSKSGGSLQYCASFFLDEDNYYLAILNTSTTLNSLLPKENGDIKLLDYYQFPKAYMNLPRNFILSHNNDNNPDLTDEIKAIYINETFKKENSNYRKEDLFKLIDYFKKCIQKNPKLNKMVFSDTKKYEGINDFYKEIDKQSYIISYINYNKGDLDKLIAEGEVYLFQIYNKDFSDKSKGRKNLHTMYFEELFSENNIKESIFKILGGGQIFYRKASHEYKVTHKKNEKIKNKNPLNKKEYSKFEYDLVKYKRYTEDKFLFHFPIQINPSADNDFKINDMILKNIKEADNINIIGIDRGERNLLYYSVINSKGEILEQRNLNYKYDDDGNILFDYHNALMKKEKELMETRKTWGNAGTIKELKEGYLSQVINSLAKLVDKYRAIIVLESLNSGFKNSRKKVERSVYQKFEKALIDKFNYLVFKDKDVNEIGGLRKGYQLTYPVNTYNDIYSQVGNIFYVNPYLTSKIDPTTGYAKLIYPNHCKTNDEMQSFIKKIKDIRFNKKENYYEFDIDYNDYIDYKDREKCIKTFWTICSNSKKRVNVKNKEKGSWDNVEINPTEALTKLFTENNIDINNIKQSLLNIKDIKILKEFLYQLNIIMDLRSSNADSLNNEVIDKIISPVKNKYNEFYDSDNHKNKTLPESADANGAYNIALKGLMLVNRIKESKDLKYNKGIKNIEYLNFVIERNK